MATKTFKIGLSNADKTAMAQDVYERLINMSFDVYDSTKTYNEGDFVVYESPADTFKLYKCNDDSVTGTWNSAKWDLATFQDLVDDIEDAVAFVNDKANVDGNYPTMTVGVADNLSPYDEESGDDQDEPFSFQATGTGNGTQPDFATGAIALMKEKQGNTVVVNQLVNPTNLNSSDSGTGWSYTKEQDGSITLTISATIESDATVYLIPNSSAVYVKVPVGHHFYYFVGTINEKIVFVNGYNGLEYNNLGIGEQVPNSSGNIFLGIRLKTGLTAGTYKIKPIICDLTQWFNGDIPQDLLDNPSNFFRYYQGSLAYNEGELVNANGRYIKCIGRNQWDEETLVSSSNLITKYPIKVIPNAQYFIKVPYSLGSYGCTIYEYDNTGALINTKVQWTNVYTTSPNAISIKIEFYYGYGTTYNHDITISLYYEGESGYDQYYPYEVLTNNDTGTETLRSAGSVKDSKAPDGTITRRVGYVDLGSLNWSYNSSYHIWTSTDLEGTIKNGSYSQVSNAISDKWLCMAQADITTERQVFFVANDGKLYFYTDDDTNSPTGTLYYELATPTTEQGTPYSENIVIDDFGSMDFSGTSGVPQGNLIFYPVDYKAFIDTLYNYTEGTPSNIALKSDLSGLVTQTDLSSGITDENANLTFLTKKVYKTGNIVVVTIIADTTSSINASTTLLKLPSGAYGSNTMWFNCFTRNTSSGTNENVAMYVGATAGDIQSSEQLDSNTRVFIELTFAVA